MKKIINSLVKWKYLILFMVLLAFGVWIYGESNPGKRGQTPDTNIEESKEQDHIPKNELSQTPNEVTNFWDLLDSGNLQCKPFEEMDTLAGMDEQVLLDTISPAVVRIENDKLFGSGVIWQISKDMIYIATNRHLIENSREVTVLFMDGIDTLGEVLYLSEEYDLGFIGIKVEDFGYFTLEDYRYVYYNETNFQALELGAELFILGSADYPAGNLYYGTIANLSIYMEDFETNLLWAYCQVKPGMSGSGVFDKSGNMIGMVCGGNENSEAAVIPLNALISEWTRSR